MLYYLLFFLARRSPMLLLSLGGIIFAIVRWKRHPRVSLMTVLALAIHMFEGILFAVFLYWLPSVIYKISPSRAAVDNTFFVLFFLEDFVFALVIILLVGAAFTGRVAQDEAYAPLPGTI